MFRSSHLDINRNKYCFPSLFYTGYWNLLMLMRDYLITSISAQRDSSILMSLVKSYFTLTEAQSCYFIKIQQPKIYLCQAVTIHLIQTDADLKFKNSHRYFYCVNLFFCSHPSTWFALVPSVLCILCPLAMKGEMRSGTI